MKLDIVPILIDIGFNKINNHYEYILHNSDGIAYMMYSYGENTDGVYEIIKQGNNFVPIRIEISDNNINLVYRFISLEFGKKWIREEKLNQLGI